MRCLSASSWFSRLISFPSCTYLPLGLNRKLRPVPRSLGVPSNPPLSLSAVDAVAYGLEDVSETGVGVGAGGGVGALRTLAYVQPM